MNQNKVRETRKIYVSLAAIAAVLVISAALVVPTVGAFATDNGNNKDQSDKNHQKDRKGEGPKDPQRCLHGASAKYNKHCLT